MNLNKSQELCMRCMLKSRSIDGIKSNNRKGIISNCSMNMDDFEIEIICDKPQNRKQRFIIKDVNGKIEQKIMILKGHSSAPAVIDIDATYNKPYYLGLYESKTAKYPISNSCQIKLEILKNKNILPATNSNYKPKRIDISSVLQINDIISYNVIHENTKKKEKILSFPYTLSLSSIPVSFRMITLNKIDATIYKSEASQIITVGDKEMRDDSKMDNDPNDTKNID